MIRFVLIHVAKLARVPTYSIIIIIISTGPRLYLAVAAPGNLTCRSQSYQKNDKLDQCGGRVEFDQNRTRGGRHPTAGRCRTALPGHQDAEIQVKG